MPGYPGTFGPPISESQFAQVSPLQGIRRTGTNLPTCSRGSGLVQLRFLGSRWDHRCSAIGGRATTRVAAAITCCARYRSGRPRRACRWCRWHLPNIRSWFEKHNSDPTLGRSFLRGLVGPVNLHVGLPDAIGLRRQYLVALGTCEAPLRAAPKRPHTVDIQTGRAAEPYSSARPRTCRGARRCVTYSGDTLTAELPTTAGSGSGTRGAVTCWSEGAAAIDRDGTPPNGRAALAGETGADGVSVPSRRAHRFCSSVGLNSLTSV